MKKKAFTLIELLVVIAIIAILMAVLMPAMSKVREQAKQKSCGSQVRQQALAMIMWADDHNSRFREPEPTSDAGYWLWDLDYKLRAYLLKSGLTKEMFFCPSNQTQHRNIDEYWDFAIQKDGNGKATGGYTVAGYCYIIEAPPGQPPRAAIEEPPGQKTKHWIKTTREKNAAESELVIDSTLSDTGTAAGHPNGNFARVLAGGMPARGIIDMSSHIKNDYEPWGGNIGFLDGHVNWRHFKDMQIRFRAGGVNPRFWW